MDTNRREEQLMRIFFSIVSCLMPAIALAKDSTAANTAVVVTEFCEEHFADRHQHGRRCAVCIEEAQAGCHLVDGEIDDCPCHHFFDPRREIKPAELDENNKVMFEECVRFGALVLPAETLAGNAGGGASWVADVDSRQEHGLTAAAVWLLIPEFGTGVGLQFGADFDLKGTTLDLTTRLTGGVVDSKTDPFGCAQVGAVSPVTSGGGVRAGALAGWCMRQNDPEEVGRSDLVHGAAVVEVGGRHLRGQVQGLAGWRHTEDRHDSGGTEAFGVIAGVGGVLPF